jgi:hypothetical protein
MSPKKILTLYLELLRKCTVGNLREMNTKLVYAGIADFLLRHGKWYKAVEYPREMWEGCLGHCYGNAMIVATSEPRYRYVEGYACPIETGLPVHHAWVTDGTHAFDPTWGPHGWLKGSAYFGVEFSVERADDAAWNGDASVLDDFRRGHPLYHESWHGEDWNRVWPPSPRLDLIRECKLGKNWQVLDDNQKSRGNGRRNIAHQSNVR